MNKFIKLVIAVLICWWVGVGIRLLAFVLPISHFWQTVIAAIVAVSLLVFCVIKIYKQK